VNGAGRTTLVLVLATIAALGAVLGVLGLGVVYETRTSGTTGSSSPTLLPSGCSRPAGGFLVVLSKYGYNDSINQGAGLSKPWPVLAVKEGQTVSIEVCNVDAEAHGFQVAHYVDGEVNVVEPGQVMNFSFVATQAGNFQIYCAIPCSIHFFMQFGQLRVSA
jgi:FtsP/CotA-like multicopper oxidase with cupredoxin domain